MMMDNIKTNKINETKIMTIITINIKDESQQRRRRNVEKNITDCIERGKKLKDISMSTIATII
jgi:hypothetical protein